MYPFKFANNFSNFTESWDIGVFNANLMILTSSLRMKYYTVIFSVLYGELIWDSMK